MTLDKIISIIFSVAILGNVFYFKKHVKTYLFPASLFSLFWFVYTFFPLVFLPNVPVNPYSILYIYICTVLFSLGSLFFDWKKAFEKNKDKKETVFEIFQSNFFIRLFYVLLVLVVLFVLTDLFIQGFSIFDLFKNVGNQYAKLRYSEKLHKNIFLQLSIVFSYLLAILGGFLASSSKDKRYALKIFAFTMIPSLLCMVVQSAKGLFHLSIIFFLAGVLVVRIFKNDFSIGSKFSIQNILKIIVVSMPVILFSILTRLDGVHDIFFKMKYSIYIFNSYLLGHIYAFSDWFSFYFFNKSALLYPKEEMSYGFYTFLGLFKFFGDSRPVIRGTFGEYFSYGTILDTNVYTMYRGLIIDFGLIGSLVFMFCLGLIISFSFYKMLHLKYHIFSIAIFVLSIGFFQSAPLVSIFMYNSIFVTFGFLVLILYINKSKLKLYKYVYRF